MSGRIATPILDRIRPIVAPRNHSRWTPSLFIGFLAVCAGCVTPVELLESTSPVQPGKFTELGPAEGTSGGFSVFNMQFGANDSIGSARDAALRESGGDALIEVSVDSRDFVFFGLFGFHRATVRGIAVVRSP